MKKVHTAIFMRILFRKTEIDVLKLNKTVVTLHIKQGYERE